VGGGTRESGCWRMIASSQAPAPAGPGLHAQLGCPRPPATGCTAPERPSLCRPLRYRGRAIQPLGQPFTQRLGFFRGRGEQPRHAAVWPSPSARLARRRTDLDRGLAQPVEPDPLGSRWLESHGDHGVRPPRASFRERPTSSALSDSEVPRPAAAGAARPPPRCSRSADASSWSGGDRDPVRRRRCCSTGLGCPGGPSGRRARRGGGGSRWTRNALSADAGGFAEPELVDSAGRLGRRFVVGPRPSSKPEERPALGPRRRRQFCPVPLRLQRGPRTENSTWGPPSSDRAQGYPSETKRCFAESFCGDGIRWLS